MQHLNDEDVLFIEAHSQKLRESTTNEFTGGVPIPEPGEEVIDFGKNHQPDLLNFP
jgi:hypothetical protein